MLELNIITTILTNNQKQDSFMLDLVSGSLLPFIDFFSFLTEVALNRLNTQLPKKKKQKGRNKQGEVFKLCVKRVRHSSCDTLLFQHL